MANFTVLRGLRRLFRMMIMCVMFALVPHVPADELTQQPEDMLDGQHCAICYSPYRKGQRPDQADETANPDESQILEDLRILNRDNNFTLIRLYDAKRNSETVLRLIKEHALNMRVLLGAWLNAEVNNPACPWKPEPFSSEALATNKHQNGEELARAIRLAKAYPDIVAAVAVGNEALVSWNDHMVPVESIIDYVRQVKRSISQPVTVCDNYDWWAKQGAQLAKELDFVSVHIYPVWEGKDINEGIRFGASNVEAVRRALPDSRIVITEAGWATVASEFGPRASEEKQKQYYHDLFAWSAERNITTFFFEAFDESWKGNPDNPLGAEKHWGIFTEDRHPKMVMQELYPDLMPQAAGK